jgi:nucleoside-diphosphate-sugar epimerase
MRAFITGASGFIGSHLAARLVRDGWQVRALVHSREIEDATGIEQVKGDIRDGEPLRAAMNGTDVLFHLASALGASILKEEEFRAVNAEGTRAALGAAGAAGVKRIVHFSSAGVLGHVADGKAAAEDHALAPRDAYDRTKLEGERIALEFAAGGANVVVIRPGWVYGPADRRTLKLFRAAAQRLVPVVGRGRTLQTPVYVDDLIEGTLLCAAKGRRGEIYNLAGPEVLTVKEIVAAVAEAAGAKPQRIALPLLPTKAAAWGLGKIFGIAGKEAPLNPSRLAFFIHPKPLDIRKAVAELGYAPAWDFRHGAATAAAWYRAHGWL